MYVFRRLYFLNCNKKLILIYFLTALLITCLGLLSWPLDVVTVKYIKTFIYCKLKKKCRKKGMHRILVFTLGPSL